LQRRGLIIFFTQPYRTSNPLVKLLMKCLLTLLQPFATVSVSLDLPTKPTCKRKAQIPEILITLSHNIPSKIKLSFFLSTSTEYYLYLLTYFPIGTNVALYSSTGGTL